MKYTIIEDHSPFYIRFTYDGIDNVIAKCQEYIKDRVFIPWPHLHPGFNHHSIYQNNESYAKDILNLVPMFNELNLNPARCSLFVTQPGYYYRAHKDGLNHRYSINYTVKILDQKCVTSWYSDEDLAGYEIDNLPKNSSRECRDFNPSLHTPLKQMIAVQGECILFNTEIFHDWDNTNSDNIRVVLTLRDKDPSNVYFDDAKKKLFGI